MEDKLIEFTYKKMFATRGGLPFSKKMWRDGYNKALQDIRNFILTTKNPIPTNKSEIDTPVE